MRQIAATCRRDRLLQQIASSDMWNSLLLRQNFVAAICRTKSNWFEYRATYRSDKISASSPVAKCVRICDMSLRQNLNQPMIGHQLVSRHVKFKLVYISSLSKSIACVEQVSHRSDLSQQQCRRGDLSPRCVTANCRILCLGHLRSARIVKNCDIGLENAARGRKPSVTVFHHTDLPAGKWHIWIFQHIQILMVITKTAMENGDLLYQRWSLFPISSSISHSPWIPHSPFPILHSRFSNVNIIFVCREKVSKTFFWVYYSVL